jgi:hypothetical protein
MIMMQGRTEICLNAGAAVPAALSWDSRRS